MGYGFEMQRCDILVVGGGVQGLWIARHASAAGASVILAERDVCGAGASGGVLGALMPHTPTGWNAKKQFQFDALVELGAELRSVAEETGIDTGYLRCGRIVPVRREGFLAEAERRIAASADVWRYADNAFPHAVEQAGRHDGWFAPQAGPFGVLYDGLSARLSPAATVAALRAAVSQTATIIEGWALAGYDPATGIAWSDAGERIAAGHIVLAAGHEGFKLMQQMIGRDLGVGIKGQAVVLSAEAPAGAPIIYDDGIYVVPHGGGRVAVGSTTEKSWDEPGTTDEQADRLLERARALCPVLRQAEVIASWAGVRPKCHERDPMVGRLPGPGEVYVAAGGYKITFGIAHRLAHWLVLRMAGEAEPFALPGSFAPEHHLNAADARRS